MHDSVLRVLAFFVLGIDFLMLVGALLLAYLLFRYRHEFMLFYQWLRDMRAARVSR